MGSKNVYMRKFEGEHHTLFKELEDEQISFYKYFGMSQNQLYVLLSKIQIQIQKQTLHFEKQLALRKSLWFVQCKK